MSTTQGGLKFGHVECHRLRKLGASGETDGARAQEQAWKSVHIIKAGLEDSGRAQSLLPPEVFKAIPCPPPRPCPPRDHEGAQILSPDAVFQ